MEIEQETVKNTLDYLSALIIVPENLIVIALLGLGFILKRIEYIPNQLIPALIGVAGMIMGGVLIEPTGRGIIVGLAFAGVAVLIYDAILKYLDNFISKKLGHNTCDHSKNEQ
jgi:hypothetical protein